MVKIIYIAGYGRSGSTLLERILSQHPEVLATGELARFLDGVREPGIRCGCGDYVSDCAFWSDVLEHVFGAGVENKELVNLIHLQRSFEARWPLKKVLDVIPKPELEEYRDIQVRIFNGINKSSPSRVEYVVDSSKTAYRNARRPSHLHTVFENQVYVVHLVRDIRGVAWSRMKGQNRALERGVGDQDWLPRVRVLAGWYQANWAAEDVKGGLPQDRYLRVRYEDLVFKPGEVNRKLGRFLGLKGAIFDRDSHEISISGVSHQIAGNRVRFEQELKIVPDVIWKRKMGSIEKRCTSTWLFP